ncbi:MAG: hypothetical protein KW788_05065 [Candidatus Doudnabacteria bacterium]|nr:hypothetical protein [Candidatus Doudnabacteria bacterium]
MAGEATHIRFALDLASKYGVTDLKKYISGAVYPDSRYITKISRDLTHPVDFALGELKGTDDFRKGWQTHLICDQIQAEITKEKLPDVFEGELKAGSDVWVRLTALKVLQDYQDALQYDISEYLPYLDYVENPNGEDLGRLRKYNQIFQDEFSEEQLVLEDCYDILKKFDVGAATAAKVKMQVEEYQNEKEIAEFLENIYDDMLERAKNEPLLA